MSRTIKWLFMLLIMFVFSAACGLGLGAPTPTALPPGVTPSLATSTPLPPGEALPQATPTPSATGVTPSSGPPTATPDPTVPPPEASFSMDVSGGSAPLTVQFSDTSEGSITSRQWDFFDGSSSTEQNPIHEYTVAGSSTVALAVSGPGGIDVATDTIHVTPGSLANVLVTPTDIILEVMESTQLAARAFDQFGNEISDVQFTWSALGTGGSISDTGLFTTGTEAGTYEGLVKVTAAQGAQTRETLVDVTIGAGPLYSVVPEPSEITLDIGAFQLFTATPFDQFGNEVSDVSISWIAPPEVGDIDGNGLLTTGTVAGTFPGAIRVDFVGNSGWAWATADVSIRPDPLVAIDVLPFLIFLNPGATQQFTAIALDQYGNEIPDLVFVWVTTNGTIDEAGLFTASSQGGVSEVLALASFRDSSATGYATVY